MVSKTLTEPGGMEVNKWDTVNVIMGVKVKVWLRFNIAKKVRVSMARQMSE